MAAASSMFLRSSFMSTTPRSICSRTIFSLTIHTVHSVTVYSSYKAIRRQSKSRRCHHSSGAVNNKQIFECHLMTTTLVVESSKDFFMLILPSQLRSTCTRSLTSIVQLGMEVYVHVYSSHPSDREVPPALIRSKKT